MKGSPFLNVFVFLLFYMPVVLPLYWVTQYNNPLPADKATVSAETARAAKHLLPALLLIQSAHPWEQLTLTLNGATTLQSQGPSQDDEYRIKCEDVCALLVEVTWPEGTPETAVRIAVQPDFLDEQVATLWGYGTLREEIIFQWNHE